MKPQLIAGQLRPGHCCLVEPAKPKSRVHVISFIDGLKGSGKISLVILYSWLLVNADPAYARRTLAEMMASKLLTAVFDKPLPDLFDKEQRASSAGSLPPPAPPAPAPPSAPGHAGLSTVEAIALIQAINSNNNNVQRLLPQVMPQTVQQAMPIAVPPPQPLLAIQQQQPQVQQQPSSLFYSPAPQQQLQPAESRPPSPVAEPSPEVKSPTLTSSLTSRLRASRPSRIRYVNRYIDRHRDRDVGQRFRDHERDVGQSFRDRDRDVVQRFRVPDREVLDREVINRPRASDLRQLAITNRQAAAAPAALAAAVTAAVLTAAAAGAAPIGALAAAIVAALIAVIAVLTPLQQRQLDPASLVNRLVIRKTILPFIVPFPYKKHHEDEEHKEHKEHKEYKEKEIIYKYIPKPVYVHYKKHKEHEHEHEHDHEHEHKHKHKTKYEKIHKYKKEHKKKKKKMFKWKHKKADFENYEPLDSLVQSIKQDSTGPQQHPKPEVAVKLLTKHETAAQQLKPSFTALQTKSDIFAQQLKQLAKNQAPKKADHLDHIETVLTEQDHIQSLVDHIVEGPPGAKRFGKIPDGVITRRIQPIPLF